MTCADFQDRISPLMDGELSHWARWKVQNHLRQCSECAAMLQDLEDVDLCISEGLAAAPAPDYLTEAVMHRLPAMPPAWRRPGATLTWSAGVAVVGMQLVALGGAYWWGYARGTETGPPVDQTSIFAPTGSITPRRNRPAESTESAPPRSSISSGGVWGKPIGVIRDPAVLKPMPKKAPERAKRPTQSQRSFAPRMQLEGAR
ncbi:MAG: anti-sigma factor family protein [Actinomycetota bacterium]